MSELITALENAIATAEKQWRADADAQGLISPGKRACLIAAAILETLAARRTEWASPLTHYDLLAVAGHCRLHQDHEITAFKARITPETRTSTEDTS